MTRDARGAEWELPGNAPYHGAEVAVVGMAGRFPGAEDVDELWRNLLGGVESIRFFDREELEGRVPRHVLDDPDFVPAAAMPPGYEELDAAFFDLSPREAKIMDPQHRLFLESAWHALENAGYDPGRVEERVGVYGGATLNTYLLTNLLSNPADFESVEPVQMNIGSAGDFLTTRISYKLDLKGPSHAVQSACSTSLVAVHLGCQMLLDEECDMALAGGVSVNVSLRHGYRYAEGGMASPDGHCRPFDASAEGTLFGGGVGVVVLKRLEDALADGDAIRAVIKGSAVNNDGSLKVGYTAPSVEGQAEVVAEALANAGVEAGTIGYVEAHGTATPLGDPIEIEALTKAFRATSEESGYCWIGSVKSNLGHLDAAAGVTGLIKTVMALERGEIPPSLHFERPNPNIEFDSTPFRVVTEPTSWPSGDGARRAGVSAFGVGGTNAHLILEAPPLRSAAPETKGWRTLLLSTRSEKALDAASEQLARHLGKAPRPALDDLAFTLQAGRRPFEHRRVVVCRDLDEAVEALRGSEPELSVSGVSGDRPPDVAFLFPGQGAQFAGMGRGLYESFARYRELIDRCAELLRPRLEIDLREILFPSESSAREADAELRRTRFAQPALFTVELAAAELLRSWGVEPSASVGHSIGEYVAATLAEVFTLEDALALVAERGRLMEDTAPGAMLSVPLSKEQLEPLLGGELALAAVNGPDRCVLSGAVAAVEKAEKTLREQGVVSRRLRTSGAFHSPLMEPAMKPLRDRIAEVERRSPRIPYISNVTGSWIEEHEVTDPDYWAEHLRRPVQHFGGLRELLSKRRILVELGPGLALTRLARRHPERDGLEDAVSFQGHPEDRGAEEVAALSAVGRLWTVGVGVDWPATGTTGETGGRRVALPGYPFQRRRYWIAPSESPARGESPSRGTDVKGRRARSEEWLYLPSWRQVPLQPGASVGERAGPWLVYESEGAGSRVADELEAAGARLVRVRPGERFERDGDRCYRVAPGVPEHLDLLVTVLREEGALPTRWLHLWLLDGEHRTEPVSSRLARTRRLGLEPLLHTARALEAAGVEGPVELDAVLRGAEAVTGEEAGLPELAPLIGLCRVLPQESSTFRTRTIDFGLSSGQAEDRAVQSLLAELARPVRAGEERLALRGYQRWVRSFEPLWLSSGEVEGSRSLRPGGHYLVTGALRDVGHQLALELASTADARLSVIEVVPGEENKGSEALGDRVRALEDRGAEVHVERVESAVPEAFARAVDEARDRFGPLRGVVHASRAPERFSLRPVVEMEGTDLDRQWSPKVDVLLALEQALPADEPEFVLLSSSLSSAVGGFGSGAYTAANEFLDARARSHQVESGAPWLSVNWDAWLLGEEDSHLTEVRPDLAQVALSPEEGRALFRRLLDLEIPQVMVSTVDLAARVKRSRERLGEPDRPREGGLDERPDLEVPFVPPANRLEETVARVWQEALGVDGIGVRDNFFALGGDSLAAVQVMTRLKRELDRELPVVNLYESLTVRSLVESLEAGGDGAEEETVEELESRQERMDSRRRYQKRARARRRRRDG